MTLVGTDDDWAPKRPTARMVAMREQMAADAAERQAAEDALPTIHVGATVGTLAKKPDGTSAVSGVVVDTDADGTHVYVVAQDDLVVHAARKGGRQQQAQRAGRLVRLAVADLDLGVTEKASHHVTGNAVRRAFLGAAAGTTGVLTEAEQDLARAGMSLLNESGRTKG